MDAAVSAFAHLVDYAGLYPPARLPLDEVARRYAAYRAGPHDWVLGRLIVPADRLVEANALATASGATPAARWPVSVLVGGAEAIPDSGRSVGDALARTDGVLQIESVESIAGTPGEIAAVAAAYPGTLERFVEIPADPDPSPLMASLAEHACFPKLRAGGVTADRFPSPAVAARFLVRALGAGMPMKATAGLHHAIRGTQPLTYAPSSATTVMHGFANMVFAAALLVAGRIDLELAEALLDDDRPEAFKFGGRAGSWLNAVVTYGEVAEGRRQLLRSVGSCSFEEPVAEARTLDWIA